MSHANKTARIFAAPAPRVMEEIFDETDLCRLRAIGDVIIHDQSVITEAVFDEEAADATIIIGQIDLPELRLKRATALKECLMLKAISFPTSTMITAFATAFASSISVRSSRSQWPKPRLVWPSICAEASAVPTVISGREPSSTA